MSQESKVFFYLIADRGLFLLSKAVMDGRTNSSMTDLEK